MRPITTISTSLVLAIFLLGCNEQAQSTAVTANEPATVPEKADKLSDKSTQPTDSETGTPAPQQLSELDTARAQQPDNSAFIKPSISVKGEGVMLQGTVRYMNLEGGFWGIVADDGKQILPKNLPQEYRKDGLRLSFTAQEITGMMTIQQWGTLSNLSEISVIGQVDSQSTDPRI